MKKIFDLFHLALGLLLTSFVFLIPMIYFQAVFKAGVDSFADLANPTVIVISVSCFFPWLLFCHLSYIYWYKNRPRG